MYSKYYKHLPLINLFLSTGALSFQVFVLYPWHEELSHRFNDLKNHVVFKTDKIKDK